MQLKVHPGSRTNMMGKASALSSNMSSDSALMAEIDVYKPVLTIISLTANDFNKQVDLITYEANLQKIISKAKIYGDVLLTTIGLRILTASTPQQNYFDVVKDLAKKNNVAFLDVAGRWGMMRIMHQIL